MKNILKNNSDLINRFLNKDFIEKNLSKIIITSILVIPLLWSVTSANFSGDIEKATEHFSKLSVITEINENSIEIETLNVSPVENLKINISYLEVIQTEEYDELEIDDLATSDQIIVQGLTDGEFYFAKRIISFTTEIEIVLDETATSTLDILNASSTATTTIDFENASSTNSENASSTSTNATSTDDTDEDNGSGSGGASSESSEETASTTSATSTDDITNASSTATTTPENTTAETASSTEEIIIEETATSTATSTDGTSETSETTTATTTPENTTTETASSTEETSPEPTEPELAPAPIEDPTVSEPTEPEPAPAPIEDSTA